MSTRPKRPHGTREWGYRISGAEYFTFIGTRENAISQGLFEAWKGDHIEICEGWLTWREDERWNGLECNEDDEWFICVGTPERIPIPAKP